MGSGLKEQWGLTDAKKGGSDKQAQEFRAAFQAVYGKIEGALGWTSTNAEQGKHDTQSTARDQILAKFQQVMALIDPEDPSKAEAQISQCLGETKTLDGVVDKFKGVVDLAKKAWEAMSSVLENVIKQIGAIGDFGLDVAKELLELVAKIQEFAAKRMWEEAKEALEALVTKLGPIYEEYLRQKEAKEKYERDLPSLKQLFDAAKKVAGKTSGAIAELIREITGGLDGSSKDADSKEYVIALSGLSGLPALLEKLKKAAEDKAAYETRLGEIQPHFKKVDELVENDGLELQQTSIQSRRTAMTTAASAGDFTTALSEANAIQTEIASYKTAKAQVAKQKTEYTKRAEKLKPGIALVTDDVTNPKLEQQKTFILSKVTEMESLANGQNWTRATAAADVLDPALKGYKTGLDDHKAEKAEYETRHAAMVPRWKKVSGDVKHPLMKKAQGLVTRDKAKIEGHATKGDFDEALYGLDNTEALVTQLEADLEARKKKLKACADRLAGLKTQLSKAAKTAAPYGLGGLQKSIVQKEGEARKAIADEDADKATMGLDWLDPALASYAEALLAMENAQEEYETRAPPLEASKKEALGYAKPIKNKGALGLKKKVEGNHHAMGYALKKYKDALGLLFALKADLTAYETFLDKLEKMETEYTTRHGDMKQGLDDVNAEDTENADLLSNKTRITERRATMEALAADGDFENALPHLDYLGPALKGFLALKKDIDDERIEYTNRLKGLQAGLRECRDRTPGKEVTDLQGDITDRLAEAETAAGKDNYDAALERLDALEVIMAMCKKVIEIQKKRIADYTSRQPGVAGRVNAMEVVDDQEAKSKRATIVGLLKDADTSKDAGDVAAALTTLRMVETELSAYAALVARVKAHGGTGTPDGNPHDDPDVVVPATAGV